MKFVTLYYVQIFFKYRYVVVSKLGTYAFSSEADSAMLLLNHAVFLAS